jgi:hypothetical protein
MRRSRCRNMKERRKNKDVFHIIDNLIVYDLTQTNEFNQTNPFQKGALTGTSNNLAQQFQ